MLAPVRWPLIAGDVKPDARSIAGYGMGGGLLQVGEQLRARGIAELVGDPGDQVSLFIGRRPHGYLTGKIVPTLTEPSASIRARYSMVAPFTVSRPTTTAPICIWGRSAAMSCRTAAS